MRSKGKFVIHKHFSKMLYWVISIEVNNKLKSWAIPHEPSLIDKMKRIAIPIPDKELSYLEFQGEIEKEEGHKETIQIWDSGDYDLYDYTDFKLEFKLYGGKVDSEYILVQLTENQWQIFTK